MATVIRDVLELSVAFAGLAAGVWLGLWAARRIRFEELGKPGAWLLRASVVCFCIVACMAPAQALLVVLNH
jgi:hypothetical protein